MKKLISIILLFSVLAGCQKKEVCSVGVLAKEEENKACFVFLDENWQQIRKIDIDYPSQVFFDEKRVYYSLDEMNFESIRLSDFQKDIRVEKVGGYLLCVNDDGSFFCQNEQLQFVRNDSRKGYDCETMYSCRDDEYFYVITTSGQLMSFLLADGSLVETYDLERWQYLNLTSFDGTVYLVTEDGYTPLRDGKMTMTYIYQQSFERIIGVFGRYLSTSQPDGDAVYRVSFDAHSIILEMMYDDRYYREFDFESIFSRYYEKGYTIINYFEISYK